MFDPDQDYPPEGAELRTPGAHVEFSAGMWRVRGGSCAGRVANPVSAAGVEMARLWAAEQALQGAERQAALVSEAVTALRGP